MDDWQDRPASPNAAAAQLLTLLLDPADAAVSEAAAEALVQRGDLPAACLLAPA